MKYLFLFTSLLLFLNCNGQQNSHTPPGQAIARTFRMASIPSLMLDHTDRANYLAKHYWDNFDFTDTAYIHLPQITEQALVDYIDVLLLVSDSVSSAAIKEMLNHAAADSSMFAYFAGLYEKYLYDPNSPMRNDELYIPVLEATLACGAVTEKIRPARLLELALKNRPGEKACNFAYTPANGPSETLYAIQADYTLVFFYNPGCHACKEITEQLTSSLRINYLVREKKLTVLAVYPDEDLAEWKIYLPQVPKEWINAYDAGANIQNNEIYDLKAIPALYLLDKDKKVILKDTTFDKLEDYFRQMDLLE
jgi:thiol-disulfide isomerase/thioredoxin